MVLVSMSRSAIFKRWVHLESALARLSPPELTFQPRTSELATRCKRRCAIIMDQQTKKLHIWHDRRYVDLLQSGLPSDYDI